MFLHRPELIDRWDLSIFVSAAFDQTLDRARIRDLARLGSTAGVAGMVAAERALNLAGDGGYVPLVGIFAWWSAPRARSTAFFRSMAERGDLTVTDSAALWLQSRQPLTVW